ncbi:MAG: PKD domain-containing protein [Pseudomonadales bacterium]|nr:PKD domain-containing protein [Pseudomonadales bacterium]
MFLQFSRNVVVIFLALALSACGGAESKGSTSRKSSSPATTTPANNTPVAHAGDDDVVEVGAQIELNGELSSDPDSDPITYEWSIVSAPGSSSAELTLPESPSPSLTPDVEGQYEIQLIVNDGTVDSDADTVMVEATTANIAPVADAGNDRGISSSAFVDLDGSGSSDGNGDSLTYSWTLTATPDGSVASLDDASSETPRFLADLEGTYTAQLIVNDGELDSDPDSVTISYESVNQAPTADGGDDQTTETALVSLDGTGSSDPEGTSLDFTWSLVSRPSGSSATLSNSRNSAPNFTADVEGAYVWQLVVSDGELESDPDRVTINFVVNDTPIADAGDDQTVTAGDTVNLSGDDSSDEEGDSLTYQWEIITRPGGSSASLSAPTSEATSFVADLAGEYQIELVVNDGNSSSTADSVTVTANEPNRAPTANAGPDQITAASLVQLNGSSSSDPDDDSLTYSWSLTSRPGGSSASLSNSNIANPTFTADIEGVYVWALVVNDGEYDSTSDSVSITFDANGAPTADAGDDQTTEVALIQLDGSGSSDPEDDSLSYTWSLNSRPGGSSASLSNSSIVNPTFTADVEGEYVWDLVVNDGEFDSPADSVTINFVVNDAPTADAGDDQTVEVGDLVSLNGDQSSDPEGESITYSWTITSSPGGSSASLSNASIVNPTFIPDEAGDYDIRLVVNDGENDSSGDTVTITATVANIAPVADAGDDQAISTSQTVQLDGSDSFDNNLDTLTYSWRFTSVPGGSVASLSDTDVVNPTFVADLEGNYMIELVVNDGTVDSEPDTVLVAYQEVNQKPTANAGPDQNVSDASVQLDGSSSSDPDDDSLTYAWSLVSRPSGSTATLSNSTVVNPSFTADVEGSYVWSLVVDDGQAGASDADSVSVTYEIANSAPTANAGPDQNVTSANVQLDGSASSDPEDDSLNYSWSLDSRPSGSSASLSNATIVNPTFTADVEGTYTWNLTVNDGLLSSSADSVSVTYSEPSGGSFVESFNGSGALTGVTTNNASALPDVEQVDGRYRAELTNNAGNITVHYNADQGRLDAWRTRFPFEFIARNIGIGTLADSQATHPFASYAYNFAGVQVHSLDLDSANSSHVVIGHRGNESPFTIEGKNTLNGSSSVDDIGANTVPNTKADIRIVGDSDGQLFVYWQLPNANPGVQADNWIAYEGNRGAGSGKLPGTQPNYGSAGSEVYIGLITYAFYSNGVPFVGTCDSIEIIEN